MRCLLRRVRVPSENMLGKKGRGMGILLSWIADEKNTAVCRLRRTRPGAPDEAIFFSKTRRVRNGVQADLQAIRWMLAEVYSRLEAARWLTYKTAFIRGTASPEWMTEVAAMKIFVVPSVMDIVELSRRINGSYWYRKNLSSCGWCLRHRCKQ